MTIERVPGELMWSVLDNAMMNLIPNGARGRNYIAESVSRIVGAKVTVPALLSLAKLAEGPIRITELGAQVGASSPTITRQIQEMEREGLVVRQMDDKDGRATVVSLSEKGMQARQVSLDVRIATLKEGLSDWVEEDLQLLAPLLERLTVSLSRGRTDF